MEISHEVSGSKTIDTHESKWFRRIWEKHQPKPLFSHFTDNADGFEPPIIVDPFARNCKWATCTNDIDPDTSAEIHMDALEFLRSIPFRGWADCVIFDPPFSPRQAEEKYQSGHINVYTDPGYVRKCMKEIVRLLKPGGVLIKLGFNSTRHDPILEATHLYYINSGGNHNDVCCSIWRIANERLEME